MHVKYVLTSFCYFYLVKQLAGNKREEFSAELFKSEFFIHVNTLTLTGRTVIKVICVSILYCQMLIKSIC